MGSEWGFIGSLGSFEVIAPLGFTSTGRIHQFQQRTVDRLRERAVEIAGSLNTQLRAVIEGSYSEGSGTFLTTTQARTRSVGRDGVVLEVFTGARHAVYLTALVSGQPPSGHPIEATNAPVLRFWWKNPPPEVGPPGVYYRKRVNWAPHNLFPGADPVADTVDAFASRFASVMIREHDTALVEFVQNEGQLSGAYRGKSPRVGSA